MTPTATPIPDAIGGAALTGTLSATDLAELMTAFNEVTAKLERTHAQLRGEVRRLSAELREANEALQRSKRLAALGEMAAGIAHEVRNPLASISLYARMLEEDLADRPESSVVASKIAGAVRGLDAVVGDVLTFAKEITPRPVACDAGVLLDRAMDACRAETGPVYRDDKSAEIGIECDPGMVHQALVNILRNAGEANRVAGGAVIIAGVSAGMVDPDDADPTPGVVLRVRDDGDGIPSGVIERMFNPFFTTRAAGTGLGLPIVHRIVDAHGGRVVVFNNGDRQPGARGATVELRLPARVPGAGGEVVVRRNSGVVIEEGSR